MKLKDVQQTRGVVKETFAPLSYLPTILTVDHAPLQNIAF